MKHFFFLILYQPLYNVLIFFVWLIPGHSVAWAIIALTILVRIILLPSSIKAAHLQVKNQQLQPKVNKIKSEIKDQKEQSQALMDLYKEEGVSPFGSCLPMLIQLPILIVLYQVFRNGLTTHNFADLYAFVPRPEVMNTVFLGINIAHANQWVLPIIAGLAQLGLSLLMTPPKQPQTGEADPMAMMSKNMLFLLPITTVLFGRAMPAALVLYWIITTLFSIGQQLYVNKKLKEEAEVAFEKKMPATQETAKQITATEEPSKEDKTKDMLYKMMNKRLDKQEKKSGVNITIRTKK